MSYVDCFHECRSYKNPQYIFLSQLTSIILMMGKVLFGISGSDITPPTINQHQEALEDRMRNLATMVEMLHTDYMGKLDISICKLLR